MDSKTLLPVEYTPLSHSNLETGIEFGGVEFCVSKDSHDKTLRMLNDSDLEGKTKINTPCLLPSEMWGLARVLSQTFGRLNEIAASHSSWEVRGTVLPEAPLTATTRIAKKYSRNSRPFVEIEHETRDCDGRTVLRGVDELLLLHDVTHAFYAEPEREKAQTVLPANRRRRTYFRHQWDEEIWRNNIHTDSYARRFGYERGLPEFFIYMDWVFAELLKKEGQKAYEGTTIQLRRVLPLYENDVVDIVLDATPQRTIVRFLKEGHERLVADVHLKQ
jgi:hypothetical protein